MEQHKPLSALHIIRDEHGALVAMLRSFAPLLARCQGDEPESHFDLLRAMLFYIEEFPDRRHHPKETGLLFPMLLAAKPELAPVIASLDAEHEEGPARVRELQHLLNAWELLGEAHRQPFSDAVAAYVEFYLAHLRTEETHLLPVAESCLGPAQRNELDAAFQANRDPLGPFGPDAPYQRLYTRIVMHAPAPIGVGPA
jgi:hemerythrin-like domain-containing protein